MPWKITRVKQPRIAGIVGDSPETTVSSLVQSIYGFTGYWVTYGKAWRARQHALQYLWGDWKEAYNRVPRILLAMAHRNPGLKYFVDTGGMWVTKGGVRKEVLLRVFWAFP